MGSYGVTDTGTGTTESYYDPVGVLSQGGGSAGGASVPGIYINVSAVASGGGAIIEQGPGSVGVMTTTSGSAGGGMMGDSGGMMGDTGGMMDDMMPMSRTAARYSFRG